MQTTDSGAASVELALFAMFLVLIAAGVIDLGRGLYTAVGLNDAVQEGAMFAAFTEDVGGSELTADHIVARVVASTESPQLLPGQVAVTCVPESRARQSATRVSSPIQRSTATARSESPT